MAKRRKNGEGCFSKNGNGYDYRIPYTDNGGNTKYKYFGQKPKKNVLKKLQIGEMNKMEFIQKTLILIGQ